MAWSILVLTPKDGGTATRVISLIDLGWKVNEAIMDNRVKVVVIDHEILHGIRKERGTGTAGTELKLLQELSCLLQIPLFQIYMDLR